MLKTFLSTLRDISLTDIEEQEQVLEKTPIEGLYWIRTHALRTTNLSRILLASAGQGNFTVVYHGADFSESDHDGYEFYGIHMGQFDVLTFLATDSRKMRGHFVDCRYNSPTIHKEVTLEFGGDPDRALVIDRGIAHIFDNLKGMVTLNQPRLYIDFNNPDFNSIADVLNVARGMPIDEFPVVHINRFKAPIWVCRLTSKLQRIQIRKGAQRDVHPFRFRYNAHVITLIKDGKSNGELPDIR